MKIKRAERPAGALRERQTARENARPQDAGPEAAAARAEGACQREHAKEQRAGSACTQSDALSVIALLKPGEIVRTPIMRVGVRNWILEHALPDEACDADGEQ